ncbi:MAG: diguanylate cyclase, partial [Gammaproteobacteria bacterium]|nr:diguanylate cyclase [Gammaproteobacteria bacterium]
RWAAEIKDLTMLPIIKKMMNGESGVMEFYSPYFETNIIAGYASIKELGWGVMVPQPKAEIDAAVATILNSLMFWSILGVIIAIISAYLLSRWISQPINLLAQNAKKINHYEEALNIENIIQSAPEEIIEMANAIQNLVNDLQHTNYEVTLLNNSLHDQIRQATSELQHANQHLQQQASSDHLTTIANRRHFENTVNDILCHKPGKSIGIMLVDIDNFKYINDHYGHAAGDYVLTTVADLLRKATRPGDIIARYGGDEFVAEFESTVKTIQKRAEELRHTVETYAFIWGKTRLNITLSIGITCHTTTQTSSLDHLMSIADTAMYQAKNAGRNQVALLDS